MADIKEMIFSNTTKYGLIGIIGLGRDASNQIEKFDLITPNRILVYGEQKDIDLSSIKQLCDVSDVIFVVIYLDDISIDKSTSTLIPYLESLGTNTIIVAKKSHASLKLATKVKKHASFIDVDKQENSDMLWTLKSLYRILYYYNDEYNFKDANYPPSMFWETFFETNQEIFLYHGDSVLSFLEKMDLDDHIGKQMDISKHCLLSCYDVDISVADTLIDRINENLEEDATFYIKNEKFNDFLLFLGV